MRGPGVEDLHRLCPVVCLVADVDGDGLSQLGEEGVEDLEGGGEGFDFISQKRYTTFHRGLTMV